MIIHQYLPLEISKKIIYGEYPPREALELEDCVVYLDVQKYWKWQYLESGVIRGLCIQPRYVPPHFLKLF